MTDQDTTKNPLDEMNDDAQSENGDANHSDANTEGDAAEQGASTEVNQSQDEDLDEEDEEEVAAPAASETVQQAAPVTDAPPVHPQTVAPRVAVASNERDFGITYGKRKSEIAKKLQEQPKVQFFIPRVAGEADGLAYDTVQINGHRMEIKKGVMVTIPRQVAEILAEKYRVEFEAGKELRADRNEDVLDHLS